VLSSPDHPYTVSITKSSGDLSAYKLQTVEPGRWYISKRVLRVPADNYEQWVGAPSSIMIEVSENSVILLPFQLYSIWSESGQLRASRRTMLEELQRSISNDLQDRLGFGEWAGASFVGFGQCIPRFMPTLDFYAVTFTSNPSAADIFVNDRKIGTTPFTTELSPDKQYVEFRKEGFSPYRAYLELQADTELSVQLNLVTESAASLNEPEAPSIPGIAAERYRLAISTFENLGNPEDAYLSDLFRISLQVVLERDKRLEVLDMYKSDPSQAEVGVIPDFSSATAEVADLLINGEYQIQGTSVFVRGVLYDVRKEGVKTALLYMGEAGIDIFQTIDAMTIEFAEAVDRVLPEAGRQIITEQEVVQADLTEKKRLATFQEIIRRRQQKNNAWQISAAIGGLLTGATPIGFEEEMALIGGPPVELKFGWTRYLSSMAAFSVSLGLQSYKPSFVGKQVYSPSLTPALEFIIPGPAVEIFLRSGALLQYLPAAILKSWDWESNPDFLSYNIPESWNSGLLFDAGARMYFYKRYSEPAWFHSIGFIISPFGGRWYPATGIQENRLVYTAFYYAFGARQ